MNKYTFINEVDLKEILWFLDNNQHRYRLLMELYKLDSTQMQMIVNDYINA